MCASVLGWPWRMEGLGTLVPTALARRAGTPNVWGGRDREPLHGRAPWAALTLPAASGPARSRASAPWACFGLESSDADEGFESRVCCPAAGNDIGDAGATALAAWLQKNTTVTAVDLGGAQAARVAATDGGVGGRLGPRPRPAAQARPMCGEGE
jgi:hypothetical protein